MATRSAAEVVRKPGAPPGRLADGCAADFITLKLERICSPNIDERSDLAEIVFRRMKPEDIDTVVVGGELVMRDGMHVKASLAEAESALRESLARPKSNEQMELEKLARTLLPTLIKLYSDW
jgi:cytosine/adenosine deaminase-related metal-dependent hydrolase